MARLKYIVHYRESPDSPQWEHETFVKAEADTFALKVFLDGGISVTVTETLDDQDDIQMEPKNDPTV